MPKYEFLQHAHDMLRERGIDISWVESVLEAPDKVESKQDGTVHHVKLIAEGGGRFLRIVVNPEVEPQRVVTAFFDRRLRRQG